MRRRLTNSSEKLTSSPEICVQRLSNQHLIKQTLKKASELVRLFGAVQAQDYWGAKWALGQRTRGASEADVEAEISRGSILRTHVLRPTWHFVAPEDIRWMLALSAPRIKAVLAHYDRDLGLDAAVHRRARTVLTKALRNGKELTRAELSQALTKAGVRADGTERLARLMMHAELDAVICNGARRGKRFTYSLLDERAPTGKTLERDAALRELALRYFPTRGPATAADFAWWSGLTQGDALRAVESVGKSLDSILIGGRKYWLGPATSAKLKSPMVRLLPSYDEYFIGFRDRSAIQARFAAAGIDHTVSGLSSNLVTIDGQAVGTWERGFKPDSVSVNVRPATNLTGAEKRAIAQEVERLASFLGVRAHLAQL